MGGDFDDLYRLFIDHKRPRPLYEMNTTDLFEGRFHCLVCEERDRPHEVTHENEVAFCFQIQCDDVIEVAAFQPEFLIGRPFKQANLRTVQNTLNINTCNIKSTKLPNSVYLENSLKHEFLC